MQAHVARLTVVAVVLIAGGCGGSGTSSSTPTEQASTFRGDFKLALTQFKDTSHAIGLAIEHASGASDSKIGTEFTGLAAQWQADLNRLSSLTPPPAVSGEFANLKQSATATEADLKKIVTIAQAHNGAAAQRAGASLVRDILAAKAAAQAISKKLGIS